MKRLFGLLMILFLLVGCSSSEDISPATELRNRIKQANGCCFDLDVTADYGEKIYTFMIHCETDKSGKMRFEVMKPETIAGIAGMVSGEKGTLTFDDKVLAFDTIADGYITPVLAPWVMMNSLKGGYITSCGEEENGYRISLNDSYAEDALQLDVWTDANGNPIRCEILYKERRCLTLDVKSFTYL